MKTLYVLRHAKAASDEPGRDDIDRPLAERGQRESARLGKYIAEAGIRPGLVCCSPAIRARETLAAVLAAVGVLPVVYDEYLYGATAKDLLALLRALPNDLNAVMIVGHNPALSDLVNALSSVEDDLPTATLVTLDAPVDHWSSMESAALRAVVVGKDLD